MRTKATLTLAAITLSLLGCSVSVKTGSTSTTASSEGATIPAAASPYQAAWSTGIQGVNQVADEMSACDVAGGGTAQGCLVADGHMEQAVSDLLKGLGAVPVPAGYQNGDKAMRTELAHLVAALKRRDAAIRAKDQEALKASLKEISSISLKDAASAYPADSGISVSN